jgi:ribonuclease D
VFDTQVAGAFLGYGLQIGLSPLLELKVGSRRSTYTDWTRRPLKPGARVRAPDVMHLLPCTIASRRSRGRSRLEWVREQLRLESRAVVPRPTRACG